MNASTVFKHQWLHQAVLQITPASFLAIQTRGRDDVDLADEISGDFALRDVRWFLNLTSSTLITVTILGLHATLAAAIAAVSLSAER